MNYVNENIVNYINSIYGETEAKSYKIFINQTPSLYIRVNASKISDSGLLNKLQSKYGITTEKIAYYSNIFKVKDENNLIGKTLEHILGHYYIQSLSSYIPAQVLYPQHDDIVMDLCSAPGSKTTELGEIMNDRGTIVANEIQLDRLKSLVHNIDRMNQLNVGVTHFKGEQLNTIYSNYFDKVLVDAPCSGLGIVQKKIEVNDWWSLERVRRLSELQLKLLVSAIKMLKPGGEIVYSTCTLTVEENEAVIDKILNKYPVEVMDFEISVPSRNGIINYQDQNFNSSLLKAKRILPWEVDSDGFFIIKLKKNDKTKQPFIREIKQKEVRLFNSKNNFIKDHLKFISNQFGITENVLNEFKYIVKKNDIFFVADNWFDSNPGIFERIGIRFGTRGTENKIIFNSLAAQLFQNYVSKNIFELKDTNDLELYMKGGTIKIPTDQKGQCIVKFENDILGTAVFTEAGLKSQFPRAFRTQEIIIK